jgi:(p)ppGpp synthase/HD superfamily hydrolase
MMFARHAHQGQVRKYTGNPYTDHLAEVAGIVSTVIDGSLYNNTLMLACAWLHDCVEDQGVTATQLALKFGGTIAEGVLLLSDMETGNRAERKALSRVRLAAAPGWVQTIKCADLISNTSSIVMHDPAFAKVYLQEKIALLDVMAHANADLRRLAYAQAEQKA